MRTLLVIAALVVALLLGGCAEPVWIVERVDSGKAFISSDTQGRAVAETAGFTVTPGDRVRASNYGTGFAPQYVITDVLR